MAESQKGLSLEGAQGTPLFHPHQPASQPNRQPSRNTGLAIHFIIRGAEKRRNLAYDKAKTLQRELGVIPRLICIK